MGIKSIVGRVNPLAGMNNQREVWAWGTYEIANQSFTLLINTLLFPVFFTMVVVGDEATGTRLWGYTAAAGLIIISALSPVMGAVADFRAIKKLMLLVMGALCVVATCLMGLLPSGGGAAGGAGGGLNWALWLAIGLYIVGAVAYALGENFAASFLPELAGPQDMARVSAFGWAIAYFGSLLILGWATIAMWLWLPDSEHWRPLFVAGGVWYAVLAIPTFIWLRERAVAQELPRGQTLWTIGFVRLWETAGQTRRYRQLVRLFGVALLFQMGMNAMIFFASILAGGFGFKGAQLAGFLLPITLSGIGGAFGAAWLQSRLGHRRTVHVFLVAWVLTCAGILGLRLLKANGFDDAAWWMLWVVGCMVGISLAGLGTSARAMVGVFTPGHKTAEFFGMWTLVQKLAAVVGVAAFGELLSRSPVWSSVAMGGVFALAWVLLFFVNEREGIEAAQRDEVGGGAKGDGSRVDAHDAAAAARQARPVLDSDARGVIERASEHR
jgi:UMF1 family MFS transporter